MLHTFEIVIKLDCLAQRLKLFQFQFAFALVFQILSLLIQFRPRIERLNTVRLLTPNCWWLIPCHPHIICICQRCLILLIYTGRDLHQWISRNFCFFLVFGHYLEVTRIIKSHKWLTARTVGRKIKLLNFSLLIILTGKSPVIGPYWFLFSFWRLSKSVECKSVLTLFLGLL